MRARNIKPGFFKNEELSEVSIEGRLLFAGLWCLADREGRLEDRPKRIRGEIFPFEEKGSAFVHDLLEQLHEKGFILRYEIESEKFIQIVNWHKHQRPHHMEAPSVISPPPGETNRYNHSPITKRQRERILARDKHRCVFCGSKTELSIDHIVGVAQGGSSGDDNLRTLCGNCNNSRPKRKEHDSSSNGDRQVNDESSIRPPDSRERPDSLIPDSLIPDSHDSLIPDTPIPDTPQAAVSRSLTVVQQADTLEPDYWPMFWGLFVAAGVPLNDRDQERTLRLWLNHDSKTQQRIISWVIEQFKSGIWSDARHTMRPDNALKSEGWTRIASPRVIPDPNNATAALMRHMEEQRARGLR